MSFFFLFFLHAATCTIHKPPLQLSLRPSPNPSTKLSRYGSAQFYLLPRLLARSATALPSRSSSISRVCSCGGLREPSALVLYSRALPPPPGALSFRCLFWIYVLSPGL